MSKMILWISFLLIIASVFLISSALYQPGSSDSPASSALLAPPSESTLVAPGMEKLGPESSAPTAASSSGPRSQGGITNAAKFPTRNNDDEVTELKTVITQLKDELKKRDETNKTLTSQDSNGISETLLILDGKLFRPGRVEVPEGARESIGNIVPLLKERSGDVVFVEGHSDSYSAVSDSAMAAEENQKFSIMRAQAVARFLEQQGIPADKIVVRGYGDTRPVTSNATQEGRSRNRRVEIKLIHSLDRQ